MTISEQRPGAVAILCARGPGSESAGEGGWTPPASFVARTDRER